MGDAKDPRMTAFLTIMDGLPTDLPDDQKIAAAEKTYKEARFVVQVVQQCVHCRKQGIDAGGLDEWIIAYDGPMWCACRPFCSEACADAHSKSLQTLCRKKYNSEMRKLRASCTCENCLGGGPSDK